MNEQITALLRQIDVLQVELRQLLHEQSERVEYEIRGKRIEFERVVRQAHKRLKVGLFRWLGESRPLNVLSAPFIYSLIVPLLLLDFSLTLFQHVCFRLYGIGRVPRSDFIVVDRHNLAYLNLVEKMNCAYCGYANGLFAYAREISARTEQYWCPIKHARKVSDMHSRYHTFLDYGDAEAFHAQNGEFRNALSKGTSE
jgi:hypothetical protein